MREGETTRDDDGRTDGHTARIATGQLMVEHATEDNTSRHLRSPVTASLVRPQEGGAKYCDGYAFACALAYLGNHKGELRQIIVHAACGQGLVLLQIYHASMSEQFFTYFITKLS